MATTRLIPLHAGKGNSVGRAIEKVIAYVKNPEKTDEGQLITTYECNSYTADAEFLLDKREYLQRTGRSRGKDDVIGYHLRQSFTPGEITPEEANRLGRELAMRFTKGRHAFIVCTHIDKHHIHNHVIFNSTSLDCTRKFRNFWNSSKAIRRLNDAICIENGYSIIEKPEAKGKTYDEWLGEKRTPSFREQICKAIDDAIAKKPKTYSELLEMLRQAGFEVRQKDGAIRGRDQKRFIRPDTLGNGYSPEELIAVLAGQRQHQPRRTRNYGKGKIQEPSLLIDVQKKLAEGKGLGYAHWAKIFNTKELSKTLLYLQEHKLLDYADLKARTESLAARFNELSDQIKTAEKRMKEISELRTQIINYAKTHEVYEAYRKAGYSKKFLAEHESEIILHKAAKKTFDNLGLKKLPTVKSLSSEYAELLAEKKRTYAEFRAVREEMKVLYVAKSNIDKVMGTEEPEHGEHQKQKS